MISNPQQNAVLKTVSPGSNIFGGLSLAGSTTAAGYTKMAGIRVGLNGTIRVLTALKADAILVTAYLQIFVNGVPVGPEHSTISKVYVGFSDDIAVIPGSAVQVYIHGDGVNAALIDYFNLYMADIPVFGYWESGF